MPRDGYLSVRMDKTLMQEVHGIFSELGLSSADALTMFYSMVKHYRGIPFELKLPNKTTLQAMKDAEESINVIKHESVEDMFNSWDLDLK